MDEDPQSRSAPQSPAADPTPAPESPSVRSIPVYLGELKSYAIYWLTAKIDALRLGIKRAIIYAILGVIGLVAVLALVVAAVVFLLMGLAGLIGNLLGHRAWAGDLIVSLLVLGLVVVGVYVGVNWFFGVSRKIMEQKYESLRNQQRGQHGRDVGQRAGQSSDTSGPPSSAQ